MWAPDAATFEVETDIKPVELTVISVEVNEVTPLAGESLIRYVRPPHMDNVILKELSTASLIEGVY